MVITMGRREYRSRRGIIRQSGLVPGHMRMAGSMGIMPDTRRVLITEGQVSLHKEFIAPFDPAGVHEGAVRSDAGAGDLMRRVGRVKRQARDRERRLLVD